MNDILSALFVIAMIAALGGLLVPRGNTITSNFGAVLLASSAVIGIGLLGSLAVGMAIIIIQTITGVV